LLDLHGRLSWDARNDALQIPSGYLHRGELVCVGISKLSSSNPFVLALFYIRRLFRFWLEVQGFRIHVAPVGRYLSRCELIAFVEDGIEQ
jgi:hypothetical protein